jgi:O-antigen ligase
MHTKHKAAAMDIATNSAGRGDTSLMNRTGIHPFILWFGALASLPLLTALLTMQSDGTFAMWQMVTRQFWLLAQIFEIVTILFALSLGCSMASQMKSLTKPVKALLLIWIINVALATVFANELSAALLSGVKWIIHCLFAISIWYLSKDWPAAWTTTFANLFSAGTSAFAVVVVSFVLTVGIGSDYDWISSLPGFPHIRHPGYILMPAIALSTWMIFKSDGTSKYLHALLLAINFGFAIWIGSRGPLMAYALLLIPALVIFVRVFRSNRIASSTSFAVALCAGALLSQSVPAPDNDAFNALSRFMGSQNESIKSFSTGRTEFWNQTLTAIRQQPLIGHGGNQFREHIPIAQNTFNHPHNSVLQFAYEWGPMGALSLIALLAILAFKSVNATIERPEENLGMFFAASAMALFSLIDGVFYYNLPIMVFLVCTLGTLNQPKLSRQRQPLNG